MVSPEEKVELFLAYVAVFGLLVRYPLYVIRLVTVAGVMFLPRVNHLLARHRRHLATRYRLVHSSTSDNRCIQRHLAVDGVVWGRHHGLGQVLLDARCINLILNLVRDLLRTAIIVNYRLVQELLTSVVVALQRAHRRVIYVVPKRARGRLINRVLRSKGHGGVHILHRGYHQVQLRRRLLLKQNLLSLLIKIRHI